MTARGGVVVWSRAVGSRYVLMASVGGRVTRLPVRSRRVQFDADVGSDADGRPVATYSRCGSEPVERRFRTFLPAYSSGRGCDLYLYDFGARRERRLAAVNRRDASEYLPSAWKGKIAFVRIYERRPQVKGLLPYLYVASLNGGRPTIAPGGPRDGYSYWDDPRRGRLSNFTGGPGPLRLDLGAGGLALGWAFLPTNEQILACKLLPEFGAPDPPYIFQARWTRNGKSRLLGQTCDQDDPALTLDPAVRADGSLTFATIPLFPRCAAATITRVRPDGRSLTAEPAIGQEGLVVSFADAGDRGYVSVVEFSGRKTTIIDVGPLAFERAPAPPPPCNAGS